MYLDEPRDAQLEAIYERLGKRPSLVEAAAVSAVLVFTLGLAYLTIVAGQNQSGTDFQVYLNAVHGNYLGFFYPPWLLFIIMPLSLLPFILALIIWNIANIIGVCYAARVFGGNLAIAVLSYQMLWVLFYGQVTGIMLAGFALYYVALIQQKKVLAGVGASIGLLKPQMGVPILLALMLLSDTSWRQRILSFGFPAVTLLVTVAIWGFWPLDLLHRIQDTPPAFTGSIALWDYVGAWSLLLYIPVLVLPMSRTKRLIAVVAASSLAIPYYQHTGLLMLMVLPIELIGLLGNLGFLMVPFSWAGLEAVILMPIAVYLKSILPGIQRLRRSPSSPASGEAPQKA
jgi:hypothetical protein